jgi:hypothetical protein
MFYAGENLPVKTEKPQETPIILGSFEPNPKFYSKINAIL